jgi:anti-anti-sigma factor
MVAGDVVFAAGELDIAGASTLVDLVMEAAARVDRGGCVVLDLADVSFLDVGGLRALHRVDDLATRAGVHLVLRDPSPAVRRLLALCDDPWADRAQVRNR